jgi:cell division transport system ATP-binding protein
MTLTMRSFSPGPMARGQASGGTIRLTMLRNLARLSIAVYVLSLLGAALAQNAQSASRQIGDGVKTSLATVEQPERGAVWVAGQNVNEMAESRVPYLRRNMGNVFQDYKLLPNKTVFENVAFALEVIGKPRHVINRQVPVVLDLVGLAGKEDRFPEQLSGGEQQRVSIARAFVNRPLIMLADEPTGNLDPATGEGIMALLEEINRTGTTVVMATHDHRVVNAMRKRVIQLDRGVIVRDQERGVYE